MEDFKSRIPALVNFINNDISDKENIDVFFKENASWGKIPVSISILGKNLKYGTIMDFYYKIVDIIMNSVYYEFDYKGNKWVKKDIDWRNVIKNKKNVKYVDQLPTNNDDNYIFIGRTKNEFLDYFYDKIKLIFGDEFDAFDFFENVNNVMGIEIVPHFYRCVECGNLGMFGSDDKCDKCGAMNIVETQGMFVPYFIYLSKVNEILDFMETLKGKLSNNCCDRKKYEEYGGDVFYDYLLGLKEKSQNIYDSKVSPTIDIPLLLTSKLVDLGVYRSYDVDVIEEGNGVDDNNVEQGDLMENIKNIAITSGQSKIRTLRKRKRSYDDNGKELPGIYNKESKYLDLPYQKRYIKNTQYFKKINGKDIFYGDLIVDMVEKNEAIEQTENYYTNIIQLLTTEQYLEGTFEKPIEGITDTDVNPNIIEYGGNGYTYDKVNNFYLSDVIERESSLKSKLIKVLNQVYPKQVCLKQEYNFTYELTYIDSNSEQKTEIRNKKDVFYIVYNNPEIEITYVIGGRLKKFTGANDDVIVKPILPDQPQMKTRSSNQNVNTLIMDEKNPYELSDEELGEWDGNGIWYRETFPMKKFCVQEFLIDEEKKELMYDVIDIEAKEITLNYEGIDFPRNKYILCEDIRYKPETYLKNSLSDNIFKDEKMMGVNFPLREEYDVVIDRGSSGAFERHLQLSELKTWADLENYRNGMFLNK